MSLRTPILLLCFILSAFLTACGGSSGSGSGGGSGTLSTSLTDASSDEYQAVYVTIARIEVHLGGDEDTDSSWKTVAEPNGTYNLLELVNGVRQELGQTALESGAYTQMRLIIGLTPDDGLNLFDQRHRYANYVVDADDDEIHELKVPSGPQTGLKIVAGFDINENQTTELILDFDALRSVVKAGASGQYLLKPTVKVRNTVDAAVIGGIVTDTPPDTEPPTDPTPLAGALITAQTSAPTAPDAKDQVVIQSGTLADEDGEYLLFLAPGSYNLTANKTGYLLSCTAVDLGTDSLTTLDFSLEEELVAPGTVSGTVTIAGASEDQYATLDFRQAIVCNNAPGATMITVKSVNIAAGGSYAVDLPVGEYQIVASTFGATTKTFNAVTVASGAVSTQNIDL